MLAGAKDDRDRAVRTLATRVDGIAVLGSDAAHVGSNGKPVVIIAGHARARHRGDRRRERRRRPRC